MRTADLSTRHRLLASGALVVLLVALAGCKPTATAGDQHSPAPASVAHSSTAARVLAKPSSKPPSASKHASSAPASRTPARSTAVPVRSSQPVPVRSVAPAPVRSSTPALCGAPANPFGYTFCTGQLVYAANPSVCDYFDCIDNFSNGKGYFEQCRDGTYSMSGGRRGACSYHGGERRPVRKA